MAFLLCISMSLLIAAGFEVWNKHVVTNEDEEAPYEVLIWFTVLCGLAILIIYVGGFSESGRMPWEILRDTPAIILAAICVMVYYGTYILGLKYTKVTIYETLYALSPACIIAGTIMIYVTSGKMMGVKEILSPEKMIPLVIMIIAVIGLTIVSNRGEQKDEQKEYEKGKYLFLGVLLCFTSVVFDSADSLITGFALTEEETNTNDFMVGYWFIAVIVGILVELYLSLKKHKVYNPFRKSEVKKAVSASGEFIVNVLYLFTIQLDFVKTHIAWAAFPVIPILMSRILFKEKCTRKQYVCIGVILVTSFALGISG